jgi:hypothetical protein
VRGEAGVILRSHGIEIDLPDGWEGRIFRHRHGAPTLHAATFPLPHHDGEFGTKSTGRMPPGGAFFTLTEYQPGKGLEPGRGLFESKEIPLPLERDRFHPRTLLVARRGQFGFQHFFTMRGRPFCLYAVVRREHGAVAAAGRRQVSGMNGVLRTLQVAPKH